MHELAETSADATIRQSTVCAAQALRKEISVSRHGARVAPHEPQNRMKTVFLSKKKVENARDCSQCGFSKHKKPYVRGPHTAVKY